MYVYLCVLLYIFTLEKLGGRGGLSFSLYACMKCKVSNHFCIGKEKRIQRGLSRHSLSLSLSHCVQSVVAPFELLYIYIYIYKSYSCPQ